MVSSYYYYYFVRSNLDTYFFATLLKLSHHEKLNSELLREGDNVRDKAHS